VDRAGNNSTAVLEVELENEAIGDISNLPDVYSVTAARDIDYQGQSFTINQNGLLSKIDALISRSQAADADMELLVAKLDQNNFITQVYGSVFVNYQDIPVQGFGCCFGSASQYLQVMTQIDVSSLGINVQVGEKFMFLYHSTLPSILDPVDEKRIDWYAGNPGAYAHGNPWGFNTDYWETNAIGAQWGSREDFDLIFQVHIE